MSEISKNLRDFIIFQDSNIEFKSLLNNSFENAFKILEF